MRKPLKKITLFMFAVALMGGAIMTSCWKVTLPEELADVVVYDKTVTIVGSQSNALISGEAGTTTFTVSTSGIATSATGSVQWYSDAAGTNPNNQMCCVEETVSTGNANRTLTLNFGGDLAPGTYYFRVTIDDMQSSNVGTLIIGEKTVTVGAQSCTLISGTAGTTTFTVSTSGIATPAAGAVQWYFDAAGTNPIDAGQLSFVLQSATVSTGSANRTLTVSIGADSAPGIYFFRVTIDYIQSNVGDLVINN